MMLTRIIFLLVATVFPENVIKSEKIINDEFKEQEYLTKICNSEPTCTMSQYAPEEMRTLKVRNCMCDMDCIKYGDCCLDSQFYSYKSLGNKNYNYKLYYCSNPERVYMKTTCLPNYSNKQIRLQCERSILPLESNDTKLIIPVTNIRTNVTYGNEYCAICNHDTGDLIAWNLKSSCTPTSASSFDRFEEDAIDLIVFDVNNRTFSTTVRYIATTEGNVQTLVEYNELKQLESDLASKFIKFDAMTKTFFSIYNGKRYNCTFSVSRPQSLDRFIRHCVPNISNCTRSSDKQLIEMCQAYTEMVFDDLYQVYRNKYCAICNGRAENSTSGCVNGNRVGASTLFKTQNKPSGETPCNKPGLKEKFCS